MEVRKAATFLIPNITLGGAIWRIHASPPANNPNANADWLAPDGASV
jgi:hypothetical protein